jgi:hypothetical protein
MNSMMTMYGNFRHRRRRFFGSVSRFSPEKEAQRERQSYGSQIHIASP